MTGRELSGWELRQQLQWRHSVDVASALPQRGGIKDYAPDGSWLQERKLENFYSERLSILREERVHTKDSLGQGEWMPSVGKVWVTKTSGKFWQNFGHNEDGKQWLYPEEALFLMDEGSLEVYWAGVALSMETAYSLLLGNMIPLHHYHVFAHLCRFGYIVRRHSKRLHLTSYERAIGIGKLQDASPARQKRKKRRKLDKREQQCTTGIAPATNITSITSSVPEEITGDEQGHCVSEIGQDTRKMSQYTCEVAQETSEIGQDTSEIGQTTSVHRSRGWFPLSWAQSKNTLQHSLSDADQTLIHVAQTLAQRCTESKLAEMRLECSSAAKWSELKRLQREDSEALVSSPASVLWTGTVKPLIQPSHAASVGKILKSLSVIKNFDHTSFNTSGINEKQMEIVYDIFLPDANFRKSDPGWPAVCLCVTRQEDPVPNLYDVVRLSQHCPSGSTLMWATVDSGDVTFFAFHPVTLPTHVDVAQM